MTPQLPDEIEVVFCDLCGQSVPAKDLAEQRAVPLQGKVVGACCLTQLRGAQPAVPLVARRPGSGTSPLGLLMTLAAVAVAAFYLQGQVEQVRKVAANNLGIVQTQEGETKSSLQKLDMEMDALARQAHLDHLAGRLASLQQEAQDATTQNREAIEALHAQLTRLEQRMASQPAGVDYRPMFDEVRLLLQRQALAIAELRAGGPASRVDTPAPAATPPAQPGPVGLSAELQAQVNKLGSADAAQRFEAVDELARSKDPLVLSHLLPMVRDADAFVRRLTVEVLADFANEAAVAALLAALDDGEENVRDQAWKSLRKLTKQNLPFDAASSKDARARAAAKWREWWEKARATFPG